MVEPRYPRVERMVWSVSGLLHAVSDAMAARFSACTLQGEISGFSRAPSGHCYLNLKDGDGGTGLLRCAMFRRAASLLDFNPADGQLVEVRGRLALYEPRGELQFVVEAMQRAGIGALYEQFLRLKVRLEAAGLFAPERKRALRRFPRRVGVVSSLGAAALHDVVTALARRAPHVEVVVYPCMVQGSEAPSDIVRALNAANARNEVDALILCRGGGSLEDLWAFNDERVVRAVVDSALPIVCGVGHETDVTLADLAADVRAPTPTAAAELVSPLREDGLAMLAAVANVMSRRVQWEIDVQEQRLDRASQRLSRPADVVRRHVHALAMLGHRMILSGAHAVPRRGQRCDDLARRLQRASKVCVETRAQRLSALQHRLSALDPRSVLARGYAWLSDGDGAPVMSAKLLSEGQEVRAELVDGHALVRVTSVTATPGSAS